MNEREIKTEGSIGTPRECSISKLFREKVFKIPKYQRPYSWEEKQIEDFWRDIKDGIKTDTIHYWGQITIQETNEEPRKSEEGQQFPVYEIVDGQQRLITITLFMYALSKVVKEKIKTKKGKELSKIIKANFVKTSGVYRLELGGLNNEFYKDLIDEKKLEDCKDKDLRTNTMIYNALDRFKKHINNFIKQKKNKYEILKNIFEYVQKQTLSLEYSIGEDAPAPRIFLIINDRGKEPTLLDKAKCLFIFYSFRYLNNELDKLISDSFGDIFIDYDKIKDIGEDSKIDYIARYDYRGLSEDTLLNFFYHYFAKYAIEKYNITDIKYDYDYTPEKVFNEFLKRSLEYLSNNKEELKQFISEAVEEFRDFVSSFKLILEKSGEPNEYKKLFSFIGPDPFIYPLIINIYKEGILNKNIIKIIETLDLRIYKVRGTDPRAYIYRDVISEIKRKANSKELSEEFIKDRLYNFISWFMADELFKICLSREVYGQRIDWLRYVLWEYNKGKYPDFDDLNLNLYKPEKSGDWPEIEHIFPRKEPDEFEYCGFENNEEYNSHINHFGNLVLLERNLGKQASDLSPAEKVKYYKRSKIPETKEMGYYIDNNGFDKQKLSDRTKDIVDFCLKRWKMT